MEVSETRIKPENDEVLILVQSLAALCAAVERLHDALLAESPELRELNFKYYNEQITLAETKLTEL